MKSVIVLGIGTALNWISKRREDNQESKQSHLIPSESFLHGEVRCVVYVFSESKKGGETTVFAKARKREYLV